MQPLFILAKNSRLHVIADTVGLFMEKVLILIVALIGFIAYVKTMTNAAKTKKWTWFVLMLLMWPLFVFYLLFAYEFSSNLNSSGSE